MKKVINLSNIILFDGISEKYYEDVLICLDAYIREYKKYEFVYKTGESLRHIGIVLNGAINVIKEDMNGNVMIINQISENELFGETFSCAGVEKIPVSIQAVSDTTILFINSKKIIGDGSCMCEYRKILIENMLKILANKNLHQSRKIEHLSKRSTRDKLLSYLHDEVIIKGKKEIAIPYNRQELADYLCVDRSALSKEICKLRDEGKIEFSKNWFKILI